jgi:hypothetical protein
LLFKQKGNNQSSDQSRQGRITDPDQFQQSGNLSSDRFQQFVAKAMERNGLSPDTAEGLLNSEMFKGKINEATRARIEQAIEHVREDQGESVNPTAPPQPAASSTGPASAWRPDAITTGDANWHPDAEIKGDDPWHPDPGSKRNDPWHPDAGSKKNDPWHPGD